MPPCRPILALPLVLALACSPPAVPPDPSESELGGATFVLWPPAPDGVDSSADNPWLTGAAVGRSSGGSDGEPAGSEPEALETGGTESSAPLHPASGGTSSPNAGEPSAPSPARLILRAYVESAGPFKGVLVEHVEGGPSTSCSVDLYSNGNVKIWRSLDLPPGLTLGERALLCVPDGASPACAVGFGGSVFNGNDALVLQCDGQVEDVLGVVGVDPGKGWTSTGYDGRAISTVDQGLWRCATGGPSKPAVFEPAQWLSWDWASDTNWDGPSCPDPEVALGGAAGL